jgi:hypothetical protein
MAMVSLQDLLGCGTNSNSRIRAQSRLPEELRLREVQLGKKLLVTTLLCPRTVCKTALGQLFRQRWNVELDLRALKTTLQMAALSCNTPQMNEKQLWVHFLAYNLIRLLMAKGSRESRRASPRHLSFKHTVQLWSAWIAHRLSINETPRSNCCLP